MRQNIDWSLAEEVTFECEPGTLSEPKVHTIRDLGVTRLSLGVENFNDKILEENGRAHLSAEVDQAWQWIQAARFPNVNIDLIAGMVCETSQTWKETVRRTVEVSTICKSYTEAYNELPRIVKSGPPCNGSCSGPSRTGAAGLLLPQPQGDN